MGMSAVPDTGKRDTEMRLGVVGSDTDNRIAGSGQRGQWRRETEIGTAGSVAALAVVQVRVVPAEEEWSTVVVLTVLPSSLRSVPLSIILMINEEGEKKTCLRSCKL